MCSAEVKPNISQLAARTKIRIARVEALVADIRNTFNGTRVLPNATPLSSAAPNNNNNNNSNNVNNNNNNLNFESMANGNEMPLELIRQLIVAHINDMFAFRNQIADLQIHMRLVALDALRTLQDPSAANETANLINTSWQQQVRQHLPLARKILHTLLKEAYDFGTCSM